jgi:hypothetical protein
MIVGTYADGRSLTYDETTGAFAVGGTLVTSEQVRSYVQARQIAWSRQDIEAWFWSSFPPHVDAVAPENAGDRSKRRPTLKVVLIVVAAIFILPPLLISLLAFLLSFFAMSSNPWTSF